MTDMRSDIITRLSDGPHGSGWTCITDDEFETLIEAMGEIRVLRARLSAARDLNDMLRRLGDQIELGPEED